MLLFQFMPSPSKNPQMRIARNDQASVPIGSRFSTKTCLLNAVQNYQYQRQRLFYHYHTSHSTTRRVTVYKRLRPQMRSLETIGRLTIAQPGAQIYRNLLALVFGMKTTTGFYVNKCGSTNLRFAIGGYWWPPSQVLSPTYSVYFSSPSYSLFEKHDSIWCK